MLACRFVGITARPVNVQQWKKELFDIFWPWTVQNVWRICLLLLASVAGSHRSPSKVGMDRLIGSGWTGSNSWKRDMIPGPPLKCLPHPGRRHHLPKYSWLSLPEECLGVDSHTYFNTLEPRPITWLPFCTCRLFFFWNLCHRKKHDCHHQTNCLKTSCTCQE